MDSFEAAKLVHDRIRKFESEQIARKVVGYVYLQDHSEQEMIRLALGPDLLIQYLLVKAKSALHLSSVPVCSPPISPSVNPISIPDPLLQYAHFPTSSPRHRILPPRLSVARYLHGQSLPETSFTFGYEDQGSLERLEMEITELLRSRNGAPISIASLPMLYFERYGRTLRAEGYLTESQRNGKAGYSLTKLLAQLNNTIRVIDRPHGQHAIMLAEHAPNYWRVRAERNDPGPIVNGSCQIYLTFPADSTFTEEDVSNYFSTFGTVKDVRIPCQPKRMFGFVSFDDSDTVNIILANGNPHFVCGARVLVKPYREKKPYERKYHEKFDSSMYSAYNMDINSEHRAKREKELEIQMRRLSSFNLSESINANRSYFNRSMEELRLAQDHHEFRMLNVLNGHLTSDGQHAEINNTQPNSNQGLDLPDSPFASRQAASI